MNQQYEAAWQIHQFLSERGIPYAVIGRIAVARWGGPPFTTEVDITILTTVGCEKEVVDDLLSAFEGRISDALEFSLKHRVLLLRTPNGCDVDVSFGLPGFEASVVSRAVDLVEGERLRFVLQRI